MAFARPTSQPVPQVAGVVSGAVQSGNQVSRSDVPQGIDMTAVAAARSSLQFKLDQNRKVRLAKIDELGASLGIVDDKAGQKFAAPWDDSFILGEGARNPETQKHANLESLASLTARIINFSITVL